jgi:hypothetical protein
VIEDYKPSDRIIPTEVLQKMNDEMATMVEEARKKLFKAK